MTPDEFARDSWHREAATAALPPIEELRARADKFRRTIANRNLREYIAGGLVIVAFAAMAVLAPFAAMKIGAAMVAFGAAYVMWQLRRRGTPLDPAREGGALSLLEFQRRELVRQRDALDSVFSWYLLPLVPGMLVLMASPMLATPVEQWVLPSPGMAIRLAAPFAVFFGVWLLNKWAAGQLQKQVDEIDALRA